METRISVPVLMADYTRWLDFVMATRQTIRRYDRQLIQIGRQHPDLTPLSSYLRACMHYRNGFFGHLALQLTGRVAQLRTGPVTDSLIRQLTRAHADTQELIRVLTDAFAEVEASYRLLFPFTNVSHAAPAAGVASVSKTSRRRHQPGPTERQC